MEATTKNMEYKRCFDLLGAILPRVLFANSQKWTNTIPEAFVMVGINPGLTIAIHKPK